MPKVIQHKPTSACPITAPHDESICGIVVARHRRSAEMNAVIERQTAEEQQRAEEHDGVAPGAS
ncbi:MAG TPA: hypothetical protein VFS11_01925 [Gemmatimonadales bacterium]|nr:hypothetical protein [Gemmatimonadales bacterium]